MSKIRNIFISITTILLFVYAASGISNAATQLEKTFLLPKNSDPLCSVNGQLIYTASDADFSSNYYSFNPINKKSSFLGKVSAVGRSSGDYVIVSDRYLFTCLPIDKRITKDTTILQRPDEVIRLICTDLEKGTTTEISRFNSLSDLVRVEPMNDSNILIYGRFTEDSGIIKSYVDAFNFKDKKWSTLITVENQGISAATYDDGKIYTINEDWGVPWPFDVEETHKPIYSLNCYNAAGKIINENAMDLNNLFTNEEGGLINYRSFMDLSVSGKYFKIDTFGSESALFTYTDNFVISLYSGYRLTCWNNFSDGFQAKIVYLQNLSGDAYVLTKETNSLVKQQKRTTKVPIVNELWDGKSDYVFATMRSIDAREPTYVTVPISELF